MSDHTVTKKLFKWFVVDNTLTMPFMHMYENHFFLCDFFFSAFVLFSSHFIMIALFFRLNFSHHRCVCAIFSPSSYFRVNSGQKNMNFESSRFFVSYSYRVAVIHLWAYKKPGWLAGFSWSENCNHNKKKQLHMNLWDFILQSIHIIP